MILQTLTRLLEASTQHTIGQIVKDDLGLSSFDIQSARRALELSDVKWAAIILRKYRKTQLTQEEGEALDAIPMGPRMAISGSCVVSLIGRTEGRDFARYKDHCKNVLGAKFLTAPILGWQIKPGQVEEAVAWFQAAGFEVLEAPIYSSEAIAQIEAERAKEEKTVDVCFRDAKIRFTSRCRSSTFNDIFSNKTGRISGVIEYLPETHERATMSFLLAEEAIGVLGKEGFQVQRAASYEAGKQAWEVLQTGYQTAIPEVVACLADGMSLFPHQNKAVKFIESSGGRCLLGCCMGSGKSAMALSWAAMRGLRVCIVGPKVVRRTWVREAAKFFPKNFKHCLELDKKSKKIPNPEHLDLVSVNYEGVDKWESFIREGCFDLLIVDECFTGETLIDTPTGQKRIDNIAVGDLVYNCTGIDEVVEISSSFSEESVIINGSIESTLNHPFLTTEGWKTAKTLKEGDHLVSTNETMRILRGNIHSENRKGKVLRNILFSEMANESTGNKREDIYERTLCKNKTQSYRPEKANIIRMAQEKQLHVQRGIKAEGEQYPAKNEAQALHSRGKWNWANRIRRYFDGKARFRMGSSTGITDDSTRGLKEKIPSSVQVRFWESTKKIVDRGEWALSLLKKGAGSAQANSSSLVRVESVSIVKHSGKKYYNFGVRNHPSYSVNGILVHNCHYIKNFKAKRTQTILSLSHSFPYSILLSGTAIKNNRYELHPQLQLLDQELYSEDCELFSQTTGKFWHDIQGIYLSMPKNEVLSFLPAKTTIRHDIDVQDPVGLPGSIEEITKYKHYCALTKVEASIEKIQDILDNSDDNVLFFSEFVDVVQKVHEALMNYSIYHDGTMAHEAREKAKETFQKDDGPRVFCSTRPSLAVGATLTRANHVVFNDLPWNGADIQQAEDRTHRIGQVNPVNVYWVVAANSEFDCRLIELIEKKYRIQKAVTEGKQISEEERQFLAKPIALWGFKK